MKEKILPDDNSSKSIEELTEEANKIESIPTLKPFLGWYKFIKPFNILFLVTSIIYMSKKL